jgi:hypothetical protein
MVMPSTFGPQGCRPLAVPVLTDDSPLLKLLRQKLAEHATENAVIAFDDVWCHVRPPGAAHPVQGWKLHLSATAQSASRTLGAALDVLLPAGHAFKFASTIERLNTLNSANYPRSGSGKFITIYPPDDATAVCLAERLHDATRGEPGPAILSDRPYAQDSVVHYRYGGFAPVRVLTNDAEWVGALVREDPQAGRQLVPDERNAWFSPPQWAVNPFPVQPPSRTRTATVRVLLGDRFEAREAIRHSNRGGVYKAVDQQSGETVVVKQARRHVLGNSGLPAQEALRHEAAVLDALAPLGHTPLKLALFEQGSDLFLAQQMIDGVALRQWIRDEAGLFGPSSRAYPGVALDDARDILVRLMAAMRAVHGAGWVLRDLSPGNVIVKPDGQITVIDLEFAVRTGESGPPGGTPGYAAPEQLTDTPADPAADAFGLGGIAFMLATGTDPVFPADDPVLAGDGPVVAAADPGERSDRAKRDAFLAEAAKYGRTAVALGPLIRGLSADTAEDRWSLERAAEWMAEEHGVAEPPGGPADPESAGSRDRLLADGLDRLCADFSLSDADTKGLWPRSFTAGSMDRLNVQYGAAGVIAVLTRAAEHRPEPRLVEVLTAASAWAADQVELQPRLLPGLYFGHSGTAWALHDAATTLADTTLAKRAVDCAARVPLAWENPDLAHGVAGAGLTQLRFWLRTGHDLFATRLAACATDLASRVVCTDGMVVWPIGQFESKLAGLTHLGFAHGSAGIAYFLLEAGRYAQRAEWRELAVRAGRFLVQCQASDGTSALWPSSAYDGVDPMEHWCSGSSGVGTLLLRLWQETGEQPFLDTATSAARALYRRRWSASPVQCHGLAGNGEFLLDLARATGDPEYRRWAEELAWLGYLRRAKIDGRLLVPDETMTGFGAEYGTGGAGFVGFLLRMAHDLPRSWMLSADPDETGGVRDVV